jgi:hypothetical protein
MNRLPHKAPGLQEALGLQEAPGLQESLGLQEGPGLV